MLKAQHYALTVLGVDVNNVLMGVQSNNASVEAHHL